jgi:SAM-dependent methyltransferase
MPAARFFDDPRYLRTVAVERTLACSEREACDAARLARCRPGARILDAGCGAGRHAAPLAAAGYGVVGLDGSHPLLRAARRAARGARFVHGSYAALPFEDGAFEAVLCLGTALGYLGDAGDRAALREFRRVLAPGGRLVVETLHGGELGTGLREREERALPSGATLRIERSFDRGRTAMHESQRLDDGAPSAYDLRVYGAGELCRMAERAGFAVIGRHATLAGEGDPSPVTPLVLVAEASALRE